MLHDVVSATLVSECRIELVFEDGKRGVVDFSQYLDRGGVFERLKDLDFFRSFTVDRELGVITWGGEIDIAPETLYAEATGSPLPTWMESTPRTR